MPKSIRNFPPEFLEFKLQLAKQIGERVKDRREQLKLSQNSLRDQVELEGIYITRSQFSRIEKGNRLPNAAEVVALAKALRVSVSWLLLGEQ